MKVICSVVSTASLLEKVKKVVTKERKKRKNAANLVRYHKSKYKTLQHEKRIQTQRDKREQQRLSGEIEVLKQEKTKRLGELNATNKRVRELEKENREIKKQKVEREVELMSEVKYLEEKLENEQVVERELRHVVRMNKLLQTDVEQADERAQKHRLNNLLLDHMHTDPKAPITVQCGNKTVKQYFPAITNRKMIVGEKQQRNIRESVSNFLGEGECRERTFGAIIQGKLGVELEAHMPEHTPTSPEVLVALHAHKKLSFDQIQTIKQTGWNTASIKKAIEISKQHKIPIESKQTWM